MSGTVTMVSANGAQTSAAIDVNGDYTIEVTGLQFPERIKTDDGAGTVLYFWADAAGAVANITPLTTLALIFTDLPDDLPAVFADWSGSSAQLKTADMRTALAKVNANLEDWLDAHGIDATTYDLLTTAFVADGNCNCIDAVLDKLKFTLDFVDLPNVVKVTIAGIDLPFILDPDIDTDGINHPLIMAQSLWEEFFVNKTLP